MDRMLNKVTQVLRASPRPPTAQLAALLLTLTATCGGCFFEKSFHLDSADLVRLTSATDTVAPSSTREWLRRAQHGLSELLPASARPALVTEQLLGDDGRSVDVLAHFGVNAGSLRSIRGNYNGLMMTAQTVSHGDAGPKHAADWPGFETVWMPVAPEVELCGRLGMARRKGQIIDATCIVLLPGFLGDNSGNRMRNAAEGLRQAGFHVLAVELRGHGETARRFPNVAYNYGIRETHDLLRVSEWIECQSHVTGTGLIGYCWGANLALLTAWLDGAADRAAVIPQDREALSAHPHFAAGVIAFCPALRWEDLLDELETPHTLLDDPVLATLQHSIQHRMALIGHLHPNGSLRDLILFEMRNTPYARPEIVERGLGFLRLMEYHGRPAGDKMQAVRVPTLIVHSADDPLTSAQAAADLMAGTSNPNIAALVLPSGGHTGFAAYARAYYYSLMVNFFDIARGPASNAMRAPANRSSSL